MTSIWLMSDLHLEAGRNRDPRDRFEPATILAHDVMVLAGDVSWSPEEAVRWTAERFERPVVYVAGNHEFYAGSFGLRIPAGRRAAAATAGQVRFLENDVAVIADVRFPGATH